MNAALASRVDAALTAFDEANRRFVARLEGASELEATRTPDGGGWTPAQIGAHVAAFNTLLAAVVSGAIPAASVPGEDFVETPWRDIVAGLSARLEAPVPVQPPRDATKSGSLAAMATAADAATRAFRELTDQRAAMTFTHPSVGTLTLPQVGEWMVAHTIRHNAQLKRALGR